MNEREIANHVLSVVDQAAYQNAASRILGVHLAIGGRRVFDPDQLQSVFAEAARGTVAEGARLFVKVLPVRHHCQNCGNNFEASGTDSPCPECNCPHTQMIGGEELRLLDMEMDDVA
ncbi:MAG TPA: hydrogenase maturation nickel metallochaperone HypA [Terriglobales bacterium]|nr:hydrogenase maturation nickel metallochaperone HypA [Terriglobales bacterium]